MGYMVILSIYFYFYWRFWSVAVYFFVDMYFMSNLMGGAHYDKYKSVIKKKNFLIKHFRQNKNLSKLGLSI